MTSVSAEQLSGAEEKLRQGRTDEAIDLLRSNGAPEDPRALALLARAYFARGDARGDVYAARFFAERALSRGISDAAIIAIRAVCAFRSERFEEAAECFLSYAVESSPPATQFMLGLSLFHAGRAGEALAWLRRAATARADRADYAEALARAEGAPAGAPSPSATHWRRAPQGLGGPLDTRPAGVPTPYPANAVSLLRGQGTHPKDFHWLEKNIPCQHACPAGTDIPEYLAAVYRGEYDRAYRINLHDNVFPAVLGRVCARPCEKECRHGWEGLGEPVAICFSKRSAADFKTQELVVLEPWFAPTGRTVAVVGAGVAGLAAARNLALMGHAVTVYEKHNRPGGMLNQGIPEFRLPREIIDREIEQVRQQGVRIVCDTRIGPDLPLDRLLAQNDAVVLAAGTLRPNLLDLPGSDLRGIRHGLDFLLQANEERAAQVGRQVVVIGGGFTAMDCARTAARLGARALHLEPEPAAGGETPVLRLRGDAVQVLYRRSQAEMLITPGELEELQHEGIPMQFMASPVAYVGRDGRVTAMRFVRTSLGEPDGSGRRRPVPVPDSEFELPADTVLLATGQFPDADWIQGPLRDCLVGADGWLRSGSAQRTAHAKVFVAGDFATGARSLIDAIGHAKRTALEVDQFLMGERRLGDVARIEDVRTTGRIREMDAVPRQPMPVIGLRRRTLAAEVETGFTREGAVEETQRCYLCHYKFEIDPDKCIYCDWCLKAKPRPDCIVKAAGLLYDDQQRIVGFRRARNTEETKLIWINQADCIRCGACVDACPVDAISVQKVNRRQVRTADRRETLGDPQAAG